MLMLPPLPLLPCCSPLLVLVLLPAWAPCAPAPLESPWLRLRLHPPSSALLLPAQHQQPPARLARPASVLSGPAPPGPLAPLLAQVLPVLLLVLPLLLVLLLLLLLLLARLALLLLLRCCPHPAGECRRHCQWQWFPPLLLLLLLVALLLLLRCCPHPAGECRRHCQWQWRPPLLGQCCFPAAGYWDSPLSAIAVVPPVPPLRPHALPVSACQLL